MKRKKKTTICICNCRKQYENKKLKWQGETSIGAREEQETKAGFIRRAEPSQNSKMMQLYTSTAK